MTTLNSLSLACYNGDLESVREIIESDESIINDTDENGWSALIWAIDMVSTTERGVTESIVSLLIAKGAKMYCPDDRYEDILDFANDRDEGFALWLSEEISK